MADGAVHGDLGISFTSRQPIGPLVVQRIPASLELTVASMIWIVLLGWPAGFIAGLYKNTRIDGPVDVRARRAVDPLFWIGTILILIFAVNLHWLRPRGTCRSSTTP